MRDSEAAELLSLLRYFGGDLGPDIHSHKCPKCSHVWTHDGAELANAPLSVFEKGHTCPSCSHSGEACRIKYHGPGSHEMENSK